MSRLGRVFPMLLLGLWLLLAANAAHAGQPVMVLAAGSTLVADIVNDLGRGFMTAIPVVSPSACPGHGDLRASDLANLGRARAILVHDWQTHFEAVMGPIRNDPALAAKVVAVTAAGNWMVPARQKAATMELAGILGGLDPAHAAMIDARARARVARIERVEAQLAARAGPLAGVPVMADIQQTAFLAWLGCNVAATYGRFEETGPKRLAEAVAEARNAGVRLVVDNLQSSGGSGKVFAEDLGAGYAVLSNFPGAFDDAPTWADTVAANLDRVLAALPRHDG